MNLHHQPTTLLLVFVIGCLCGVTAVSNTHAHEEGVSQGGRGFGDHINWLPLDTALALANETQQPVMVIIHKSWCGACKKLGPILANSPDFAKETKNFLMVNLQDHEEPTGNKYAPDGGYVPRILFLEPSGMVREDMYNKDGLPQYKYFYSDAATVIKSMKRAQKEIAAVARKPEL